MYNSTPKLIFPQPTNANLTNESWYHLECPAYRNDKFWIPFLEPRRMWLKLTPHILAILLKHGWKEVI